MSERRVLQDPILEEQFQRDGFVVVDLAPPEVIAELQALYDELDSGIDDGYYPSLMSADEDYKASTHREVAARLWPLLSQVLESYEPLLGVFMVKHPGPETEVVPHQDWIIAEENGRPSISTWLPLTPVDEISGRMAVLPGSNHWLEGLRGSPTFPTQWEGVYERVRDELMQPLDIKVGQAMVYDVRLLHGTPPNLSGATRVVASLYAIPEGAAPIHYHRDPAGAVRGYQVPRDFCTTFRIGDVPGGDCFVELPGYTVDALDFDEIAARSGRATTSLAH